MSDPMVAEATEPSTAAALPIAFEAAGSWCFGWFHAARGPARGVGVVLCRPFGYEAMCTYRTYTVLAETLASDGFDVVRFDYHGTGDSAGSDTDPDRVPAWLDSTAAAIDELKSRAGISRIALFGVRLGGTLAAHAAARIGGVESLVLWAPCTGRAYVRELRAAGAPGRAGGARGEGDVESLGYLYGAATLRDIQALDQGPPAAAPARRMLIIGRDDMPGEGPLPARYRAMGIDTTSTALPGYADMMVEPHESRVAYETLGVIREWLAAAPQPALAGERRVAHAPGRRRPVDLVLDGVREAPLMFGADHSLFGVLAEPEALPLGDRRAETAILLLSVGGNHRIGPNRNYVKFARALAASGYRALRLDLSGVGDSRTGVGFSSASMYSRNSTGDVRAAIDCLAEKGCKRFYLMGICSGSYVAFQTAQVDPRVTGQILMNSRLLEWQGGQEGATWEEAMLRAYKSIDFYRRSLSNPRMYWRLLRGQVDVNGIALRLRSVFWARIKRKFGWLSRRGPAEEAVLSEFKQLSARGTDTLMLISEDDDGRDYVEFHLGPRGRRLRHDPNFRMVIVRGADHTFSRSEAQQFVLATVREHLEARASLLKEREAKVYLKGAKILGAR
jgi:pimeloyl-ACP methyl ester carboxylesterase